MKKFIKLAAITFFFSVPMPVLTHLAHAQEVCGTRTEIVANLAKKFKEKSTSWGLVNGSVLEVFTSPGGNTWTIIVTEPTGRTCFVSSGSSWGQGPMAKDGTPL